MYNIGTAHNNQISRNNIRGASHAFEDIENLLRTGAYQKAEVEMLWHVYPSVSTRIELAMGNLPPDVSKGYVIKRV